MFNASETANVRTLRFVLLNSALTGALLREHRRLQTTARPVRADGLVQDTRSHPVAGDIMGRGSPLECDPRRLRRDADSSTSDRSRSTPSATFVVVL